MRKEDRIVIVGAGVFGLSTAYHLATEGYQNITILDRHIPPVPDGSSVDISRVIRFDYADDIYMNIAYEAYKKWSTSSRYKDIFFPAPFILGTNSSATLGSAYVSKCTEALTRSGLPWKSLHDPSHIRDLFPTITGSFTPSFSGYTNAQAGWADAHKAISQLREDCSELGVSFVSGPAGTVVQILTEPRSNSRVRAVKTLSKTIVEGDHFVLAAGAWASSIAPMYGSTLSTAQVIGYMRLTEEESMKYKDLPICINMSTGWFVFPPHPELNILKMAVHGWGYTRSPSRDEKAVLAKADVSTPPLKSPRERANFVTEDGEKRLRENLVGVLPELANRPFERASLCWYTDTPSGDFIMDYHPDYKNLFVAGGGSGHAFKFLPVLGEYVAQGLERRLPDDLAQKWRFRTEYKNDGNAFVGDGSRGGPARRELRSDEIKASL